MERSFGFTICPLCWAPPPRNTGLSSSSHPSPFCCNTTWRFFIFILHQVAAAQSHCVPPDHQPWYGQTILAPMWIAKARNNTSTVMACICTVKVPAPGMLLILMGMVAGKKSSRVMLLLRVQTASVSGNTMMMLIGTMVKSQSAVFRVQCPQCPDVQM